jgi:hypothetical protein
MLVTCFHHVLVFHGFPGSALPPTGASDRKLLPGHRIRDYRGTIPMKEATSGAWGFQPQNKESIKALTTTGPKCWKWRPSWPY